MKLIYILLLLFPVFANSQNLCSYDKEGKAFNKYDAINDVTNTEDGIRSIVNLITEKIGVFPNFVLQRVVEEENCFAWIEPKYGLRIISYDREFLVAQSKLSETNYWAIVFILSHEIGHHINGHTIGNFGLEESRNNELQADQFAGFIFKKLNGKKEDLIKILDLPIFESNSENSTHPGAEERLTSALKGYNNAQIDNFKIIVNEFEIINSLVMSVNQISSTIESNLRYPTDLLIQSPSRVMHIKMQRKSTPRTGLYLLAAKPLSIRISVLFTNIGKKIFQKAGLQKVKNLLLIAKERFLRHSTLLEKMDLCTIFIPPPIT